MIRSPACLLAALLLAACEAKVGMDDQSGTAASAAGKAESGTLSIDTPGFDMKLKIPEAIRAEIGGDNDVIYPGSTLGGLHVAAQADGGGGNGSVEMRFTSPDAVDKVAAWYRDPARAADLKVASAGRQGEAVVMNGVTVDRDGGGGPFTLRLRPNAGGTEGVLTLSDRGG